MDFSWSVAQQARYDATLAVVRERFGSDARPKSGFYTREDWLGLGELGLLGLCIPARHGGGGLGALETARLVEAFGRGCPDTGLVFASSAHQFACAAPIAAFAGDAVKETLLPKFCSGALIAGNAMTEAEAGSDVARLAVTATEVPGGYVLNGEKSFVSNGPVADVYVTYATTDPSAGHLGASGFVVDRDTRGVLPGEPFDKMGLLSCPAGTVRFEDCFVPAERLLGEPGQGAAIFQHSMGWERACLFAGYVGMLDRLVERAAGHVRERRQFGKRIADFQSVTNRVVDMYARLESARLLLYRACWQMDRGEPASLAVALSKLAVSESAVEGALDAIRLFGARGYLRDDAIEAALRDSVPSLIFSGTSDIQRLIIAKELGL